jgi:hypothetical protein
MILASEVAPGVVQVLIHTHVYGQAGEHWKQRLNGPNHGGYGRIFIQRYGANQRRYQHCYDLKGYYVGSGADIDECPGAMFIWPFTDKEVSTEAIDAIDNRSLGSALGLALRQFEQKDDRDLWEVLFRFT